MNRLNDSRIHVIDGVDIDDDLIRYTLDTFSWVPSVEGQRGLNYHGITLIPASSSKQLIPILSGWLSIFSSCQEEISLMGGITDLTGTREIISLSKIEVIHSLQKLLQLVLQLQNTSYFLLHLGI